MERTRVAVRPGRPAAGNRVTGTPPVSRRDFFRLAAVGGTVAVALMQRGLLSGPAFGAGTVQGADAPAMYDPETTGLLRDAQKDALWSVFDHIGERWRNAAFNEVARTEFDRILDLKTSRTPSYLAEYVSAVNLLDASAAWMGDAGSAAGELFEDVGVDGSPQRHAHTYVVSEFIMLQIAFGGFRKWGYVNYPGYAGGSFRNPYRV